MIKLYGTMLLGSVHLFASKDYINIITQKFLLQTNIVRDRAPTVRYRYIVHGENTASVFRVYLEFDNCISL